MKKLGTISYNIYCNFTNYGSAFADMGTASGNKENRKRRYKPILVDYCPDILTDKDPLNPFANMWDKDETAQRMCRLTLPAIKENYFKFDRFYRDRFDRTTIKYTSENFNDIMKNESLDGFICGSDTIFCIDEFGFDNGYYAEFDCMRNRSAAYAASFGDSHFNDETYKMLNKRLLNFKAIGLRENSMLSYVEQHTKIPVKRVLDPTLLLTSDDYDGIAEKRTENEKYILLYARRYDPEMEAFAEKMAAEQNLKIVEISLRAENSQKPNRRMFYEAGVEEFLSLVKYAEFVVTNSFHGMIFAVQYRRQLRAFLRDQCDTKITELLDTLHLNMCMSDKDDYINYDDVHLQIERLRGESLMFLKSELELFA